MEQIKILIQKYKDELKQIESERSIWDDDYEDGLYWGAKSVLEDIIKDLENVK